MKKFLFFLGLFCLPVFFVSASERVAEIKIGDRTVYFDSRKTPCGADESLFEEGENPALSKNYSTYADAIRAMKESGALAGRKILPSFGIISAKIDSFDREWINAFYRLLREGWKDEFWGERRWFRTLIDKLIKAQDQFLPNLRGEYEKTLILLGSSLHSIDTRGLPENFPENLRDKVIERAKTIDASLGVSGILLDLRNDSDLGCALVLGLAISQSDSLKSQFNRLVVLRTRIGGVADSMTVLDILPYLSGKNNRAGYFSGKKTVAFFRDILKQNDGKFIKVFDQKSFDGKLLPIDFRLLPVSRPFEKWLLRYPGAATSKENPNFMDALVIGLQRGKMSFLPSEESGYYTYKMFARESLVRIDRTVGVAYRSWYRWRLARNFESFLPVGREAAFNVMKKPRPMQVNEKQIVVDLSPVLRLEPLPMFYLRSARAYSYVLKHIRKQIHVSNIGDYKVDENRNFIAELEKMKRWCYGLFFVTAEDLGLDTEIKEHEVSKEERATAKKFALKWIDNFEKDPVMTVDWRKLAPTVLAKTPKDSESFWACAGIGLYKMTVDFYSSPEVLLMDGKAVPDVQFIFKKSDYIMPAMEFFTFSRANNLPKIDEAKFKAMTDRYVTTKLLKAELAGPPPETAGEQVVPKKEGADRTQE